MILECTAAAGTALTNSIAETELAGHTLPANSIQPKKAYRVRALVRTTAQNATDTLTIRAKVAGTTVYTSAAVDQAAGDVHVLDLVIAGRSTPTAADTLVVLGSASPPDAAGSAMASVGSVISSVDTTADVAISITGQWSVANAGNSCQAELLLVEEIED